MTHEEGAARAPPKYFHWPPCRAPMHVKRSALRPSFLSARSISATSLGSVFTAASTSSRPKVPGAQAGVLSAKIAPSKEMEKIEARARAFISRSHKPTAALQPGRRCFRLPPPAGSMCGRKTCVNSGTSAPASKHLALARRLRTAAVHLGLHRVGVLRGRAARFRRQHNGAAALPRAFGAGDIGEDRALDALLALVRQFDAKAHALAEADIVVLLGNAFALPRRSGIGHRRWLGGRLGLRGSGETSAQYQRSDCDTFGFGHGIPLTKEPVSLGRAVASQGSSRRRPRVARPPPLPDDRPRGGTDHQGERS